MDIREIVNRNDTEPINEDEAYFLIKSYIHEKTGKVVEPRINYHNYLFECRLMHDLLNHIIAYYRNEGNIQE